MGNGITMPSVDINVADPNNPEKSAPAVKANRRHLINVHSTIVDKIPGVITNDMRYGELAVNHTKGKAFLSTRVGDNEEDMELFPSIKLIEQHPFSSLTVDNLTVKSGTTLNGKTVISGDTHIEKVIASDKTFDSEMNLDSKNAVQNKVVTKTILDNEKVVAAALNDLNTRKIDYSGVTGDEIINVEGKASDNVKLTHKKGVQVNKDGVSGENGVLTVNKTDEYGHVVESRPATSKDIEKFNFSNLTVDKITVKSGTTLSGTTVISGTTNISGDTFIEKVIAGDKTFDNELKLDSVNAVQNKVITKKIVENEKVIAAALNDLNTRKVDFSGITGDEAITVEANSCNDIKLTHKKGVQVNQGGVSGTNGVLTVNKTDEFGHIIESRPATANDIEKLGVASKGLGITYGDVKTVPSGFGPRETEHIYDGKTKMSIKIPQKITDLEGGNELAYVHITGDTMTGPLKLSTSATETPKITLDNANGTINATGAIYSSDERLKDNIENICSCKFGRINDVHFKQFVFKDDDSKRQRYGVIAQELQNVGLENLVEVDDDGYLGVDYISLIILKLAEMNEEMKKLKNELDDLKAKQVNK